MVVGDSTKVPNKCLYRHEINLTHPPKINKLSDKQTKLRLYRKLLSPLINPDQTQTFPVGLALFHEMDRHLMQLYGENGVVARQTDATIQACGKNACPIAYEKRQFISGKVGASWDVCCLLEFKSFHCFVNNFLSGALTALHLADNCVWITCIQIGLDKQLRATTSNAQSSRSAQILQVRFNFAKCVASVLEIGFE